MNITGALTYTCSMAELGNVDTSKNLSKRYLKRSIYEIYNLSIKILIYNSTSDPKSNFSKSIVKLGFKPVFTYMGNEGTKKNPKIVTTYMLDLVENKYL